MREAEDFMNWFEATQASTSSGDFEDYGRDNTVTIDGKSFRNGNLTVLRNLPTSCAGQPRGTVWNNKGALALCP